MDEQLRNMNQRIDETQGEQRRRLEEVESKMEVIMNTLQSLVQSQNNLQLLVQSQKNKEGRSTQSQPEYCYAADQAFVEQTIANRQKQQSSLAISNTAANRRLSPDQGNPTSFNLNFSHKLEFPKFDGSNARIWIKKCEKYFELCKIPENQKIDLALLHMTGRAKMWVTIYLYARSVCWSELIDEIVVRFGGDTHVDVCESNGRLEVTSESAIKPDIEPGKGRNPQLETEKVPTTIAPELFEESPKKEKLKVEAYELNKVQTGPQHQMQLLSTPQKINLENSRTRPLQLVSSQHVIVQEISKESIEPMVHLLNSDILSEVTTFDSSHDWGEDYQEQHGLEGKKDQAMEPGTVVSPAVDFAKNLDSPSISASLIISTNSMVPPTIVANGGDVSIINSPVTSRVSMVYSEVQNGRLDQTLPLPSVIKNSFSVIDGPASSAVGNPDEIAKLFPCLFGQPSAVLVPGDGTGRAASHITLECVLQTHPNIILIGEEVACKKETLQNVNVTDYIADVVCKQAESDGLIGFIPEVQHLIEELNEILASGIVDEGGLWKKKLSIQPLDLFEILPSAIQDQWRLGRDPHGNIQVTKIETEIMLIQMVETELEQRSQTGSYKSQFKGQLHFCGYEERCSLPSNFDATYCYVLGYGDGALLHSGNFGLISLVGNIAARVEEWTVGCTVSILQSFHQSFLEGRQLYVLKFIEKSERKNAREESIFTNLYVKTLSEDVTEDVLRNKFSEYGNVFAVVIMKDSAGKSKGLGFDGYKAHEDASIEIEDTEAVKPEGWLDDGPAEIEDPEAIEITRKFMNKPVRIHVQRDELIFEGIKQFHVNVDKEKWKWEVDWFTFGAFPRVKLKFNIQKWWLSNSRLEDKSDVEGKALLWHQLLYSCYAY